MKYLCFMFLVLVTVSCAKKESEPIKLNVDSCSFCKMKIADGQFGAELITKKGRVYKFDDLYCMMTYREENAAVEIEAYYVHDFNQVNVLIPAATAFYVQGSAIHSPMRGNYLAVKTKQEAEQLAKKYRAQILSWDQIVK